MVEPLTPDLSIFCRVFNSRLKRQGCQIFQKCKSFSQHITTRRRLTQDEDNWTKKGSDGQYSAGERAFKEECSCQARREETIPVKKTLRKKDQPATSTEHNGQADNGDVTAAEMLTHRTSGPV